MKSAGARAARSGSSVACASMGGRKGAGSREKGFSARPSSQANICKYGGASPGQRTSTSSRGLSPRDAAAGLARPAETPNRQPPGTDFKTAPPPPPSTPSPPRPPPPRKPPVPSFKRAQRPVSSSPSSQRTICAGNCVLPSLESFSTTSDKVGAQLDLLFE